MDWKGDTGTLSNQSQNSDAGARGTLTLFLLKLCELPEARIAAQRGPFRVDAQQPWRELAWD